MHSKRYLARLIMLSTWMILRILLSPLQGQSPPIPKVLSGKIIRHESFPSRYVEARHIDVWVPEGYDTKTDLKYDVLYMHDGQMLFDSSITWNHQAWEVDKTLGKLQRVQAIRPCLVVGIWNVPHRRYANYFPQKIIKEIPSPALSKIMGKQILENPNADNYLAFIVRELKPFIDSTYSVSSGVDHTFMMGSSMGGLISLYGLCEYPEIFGGVACLSIHSPVAAYTLINENTDRDVASKFRDYLMEHLPKANSKKIYLDYGDQTGDAYYASFQKKIDDIFILKGHDASYWTTRFFEGESHSEISWAKRLEIPVLFLLGN